MSKKCDVFNINLKDGFWREKQELNRKITINAVYNRFKETGRVDALSCKWREGMEKEPHVFWDSDIAKWIEGAAYILGKYKDSELENKVEGIIDYIEENICEDGYYNSYYITLAPEKRFSDRSSHELYCAGHLIEAAVAYYEATGKDRFLNLMCRYADYIYHVFVIEDSASFRTGGHEEIEYALWRLYRCTGKKKYFELMEFFLKQRGNNDKDMLISANTKFRHHGKVYAQDHSPVFEQSKAKGHAVRALYLYRAMLKYALETGNQAAADVCREVFDDIRNHKMYVTGGIGSSYMGEDFTKPYDLPSDSAYSETCAAIALALFANEMFDLEQDSKYTDVAERVLYNGMLSGLSLTGDAFFYENPLEINLAKRNRFYDETEQERFSMIQRLKVFECSCCPPNLNRILASVEDFVYGVKDDCIYINQYIANTAKTENAEIKLETDYPRNGEVIIQTAGVKRLALRIPSWCTSYTVSASYIVENGYAYIENPSGEIRVKFDMKTQLIAGNPRIYDIAGKVAVQKGPIVYCAEKIDNNVADLHALYIDKKLSCVEVYDEKLNTQVLQVSGWCAESDNLYDNLNNICYKDFVIEMIPYSLFANRGESDMLVWLNYR